MARPKGKTLTLDDVLAASHGVIEREGPAALTLTRVARALSIAPPSLCHHVPTNEELRLCMAEHSWSLLAARLALVPVLEPRQHLRATAAATRAFALEHPRAFELLVHTRLPHARVVRGPLESRVLLPLLANLRELGVPKARRIHAARAFRSAITGFLLLEISGQFQLETPANASFDYLVQALLAGLYPSAPQPRRR